jgi:hypothetical protein
MEKHVTVLGVFYIAYGVMGLIGMMFVLAIFLMGGAFIPEIAVATLAGSFGIVIAGLIGLTHVPALVAGYGLLKHYEWARILALIVGFINVMALPFGTIIAVYAFWTLLKDETIELFKSA